MYYRDTGKYVYTQRPNTNVSNASVTINGRNIRIVGAAIAPGWAPRFMTFSGVINADNTLAMVSADINGVHNYLFHPATDAVTQLQAQFQQVRCG